MISGENILIGRESENQVIYLITISAKLQAVHAETEEIEISLNKVDDHNFESSLSLLGRNIKLPLGLQT